jgi:NTE family protein
MQQGQNDIAVMLTGGGARAAYQVGLIKGLARHFPKLEFQIITGVSAGAINATFLASRHGNLATKGEDLADVWCELQCSSIWQFDWQTIVPFRTALASVFWRHKWSRPHGLVDTRPLEQLLYRLFDAKPRQPIPGIIENLNNGLRAVALMTLDYSTGQSVRWMQGRTVDMWEGPNRRSEATQLTVQHVMASSALPFFFPAVRISNQWYGDGGMRLAAPLSAPVQLGARRIIAMSTGYQRTQDEAQIPVVTGYPPAAQILGQLFNAIFLDVIDEDVRRMERMNALVSKLEPRERGGFKVIDLLVLRPSVDLGKLSAEYERYMPRNMKLITRALGAKETESPDFLSLLMFEPHYIRRLIEIGEADVASRVDEVRSFLGESVPHAVAL